MKFTIEKQPYINTQVFPLFLSSETLFLFYFHSIYYENVKCYKQSQIIIKF